MMLDLHEYKKILLNYPLIFNGSSNFLSKTPNPYQFSFLWKTTGFETSNVQFPVAAL
jgi:hypothetical protein